MSDATMQAEVTEVTEPATEKKSRVGLIIGLVIALVVAVGGVATAVVLTSSTFDPQTVAEWAEGSEEGEAFLAAQSEFNEPKGDGGGQPTADTIGPAMTGHVVTGRDLLAQMNSAIATLPEGELRTELVELTALYTEALDNYEASIPAFVSLLEAVENPSATESELEAAVAAMETYSAQIDALGPQVAAAEDALGL